MIFRYLHPDYLRTSTELRLSEGFEDDVGLAKQDGVGEERYGGESVRYELWLGKEGMKFFQAVAPPRS
jgi:hypothetical protein